VISEKKKKKKRERERESEREKKRRKCNSLPKDQNHRRNTRASKR
jgi:hypothetical protein